MEFRLDLAAPILLAVVSWLALGTWWLARIGFKVDTMWKVLVQDAILGARHSGVLQAQSPDRLDQEIARQFTAVPLGAEMRTYYRQNGLSKRPDSAVLLDFAGRFGTALAEQVQARAFGDRITNLGQALVAALQFCKDDEAP